MLEHDANEGVVFSRRAVLRAGLLGGAAFAYSAVADGAQAKPAAFAVSSVPAVTYNFNQNWLFGGVYTTGSEDVGYPDGSFAEVTVPHTVTPLSWGGWDPASWEYQWIYRKHFDSAAVGTGRVFVDFDGVMTSATVFLNGVQVSQHQGGYLPWSVELTPNIASGDNVLAVIVDATGQDVPPDNPTGPSSIGFLQPGGIYRDVALRVVPEVFLSDVFAMPTDVLSTPSVAIEATIDAAVVPPGRLRVTAQLLDGAKVVASAATTVSVTATGTTTASLTIGGIGNNITLWSPDTPKLYSVRATISGRGVQTHSLVVRTGFREASFELDGFYLNGQRFEIFGLNRHQLFPYTGMAMSSRLQQRDAYLLKTELNCNMVRCSHYPQSPHFLDACDELGLMVWEEPPGWQYMGDAPFQEIVVQNVNDMVIRDRNRPSVIVWATRLNESANYPALYAQTRQLAYTLDGSRQTTGSMTTQSTSGWAEDLFAYDDYDASGGNAFLKPPVSGVPYMVSEAVGSQGGPLFRWIDTEQTLQVQAQRHAQVHDIAQSNSAYAGLLGWAGIDYAALNGTNDVNTNTVWNGLKWSGILDTFRVPKPGAAFYRSQVNPSVKALILPVFFWDFGSGSPANGPGPGTMIATNCDRLELYVGSEHLATGLPDTQGYPNLAYPPVFVDLTVDGSSLPELIIHGYVGTKQVAMLRMSSNPATDRLLLAVENQKITSDGSDMTRFTFRAVDTFGNQRPYVTGDVTLSLTGPAALVADNPFAFGTYGGVGGGFLRSLPGQTGPVTITATHPTLGQAKQTITVTPASGKFL